MKSLKMIGILSGLTILMLAVPVSASDLSAEDPVMQVKEFTINTAEDNTTNPETQTQLTFDDVYAKMKNQLISGEEVKIQSSMDEYIASNPIDLEAKSMYDLTEEVFSANIDYGQVNEKYENFAASATNSYISADLSGKSQGCMELFNSTYGDIYSQVALEEPTIPEEFNVDNMLKSAQSNINSLYSTAISDSTFATVKNNISIGDVFSLAEEGLDSYSLMSGESLSNLNYSFSSSSKTKANTLYNEQKGLLQNIASNNDDIRETFKSNTEVTSNKLGDNLAGIGNNKNGTMLDPDYTTGTIYEGDQNMESSSNNYFNRDYPALNNIKDKINTWKAAKNISDSTSGFSTTGTSTKTSTSKTTTSSTSISSAKTPIKTAISNFKAKFSNK